MTGAATSHPTGAVVDSERRRLAEARDNAAPWLQWGPYLSDRQWGTVREDYSPYGTAWDSFPHDHARSRAYRWGEDGLLGISDDQGVLCFALALWNEADPILKERLFGLTGPEGNHGEDVKEYYYFLDSTPTHMIGVIAYAKGARYHRGDALGRPDVPPKAVCWRSTSQQSWNLPPCSVVSLAGPPGRGRGRSASTLPSRPRLIHWLTAPGLTPNATAMSFCHHPA